MRLGMRKNNQNFNMIFLFTVMLYFTGCGAYLSVTVVDSQSGVPLDNVTVEATPEGMPTAQQMPTVSGIAEFKTIKKAPVKIVIPKSESHFAKTIDIERGIDLKTVEIKLDSLQTILYGKVLDTLGRGIADCLIRTEPTTDTLRTDSDGLYTLKSKQFVEMYYDVIAMHDEYRMNRKSNIFIRPDNEHWIQPIRLEAIQGFKADSLGPSTGDFDIGDDAVRLDDF